MLLRLFLNLHDVWRQMELSRYKFVIVIFSVFYFVSVNKYSYAFSYDEVKEASIHQERLIKKCAEVYADSNKNLFDGKETIYITIDDLVQKKLLPSENGKINLDYALFEKDALVFKHLKSDKLTLLKNNQPYISVEFKGFPYLGIWTKPNAPFLCIEPWCGLADNVNHNGNIYEKEGIQLLDNNVEFEREINITLL